MKVTLDLSEAHFRALLTALETTCRCGMGQFASVADLFDHGIARPEQIEATEDALKPILTPGLQRHAYHGIFNKAVPKTCRLSYELFCALRYVLSHSDPKTPESSVWKNEPMSCTDEAMPTATIER